MTEEVTIKSAYLMWVGKDHYPTIADFVKEATEQGISKRLPNANIAANIAEPGTVVFLAHDEGEYVPCGDCHGEMDCTDCRKRDTMVRRWKTLGQKSAKKGAELAEKAKKLEGDEKVAAEKQARSLLKEGETLKKRSKKIAKESESCEACGGTRKTEGPTGGWVMVDGNRWDYIRFDYWVKQPQHFSKDDHKCEHHQCETCGGKGRLPVGRIFGVFVPDAVEYITRPEDEDAVREKMTEKGCRIVDAKAVAAEAKRGCGYRKSGGVYVVTSTDADEKPAKDVLKELVKKGVVEPEGADVKGQFVSFMKEVPIPGVKRFRGIRRYSLDSEVEDEAEIALEAIA